LSGCNSSGKTSTIVFIVRLLIAKGKRVLISSYTHGAVDTVLLKLIEKGLGNPSSINPVSNLIRVGLKTSCHPDLLPYLASNVAMSLEAQSIANRSNIQPSAEALKKAVSAARVVGVTALSAPRSALIQHEQFDVVIVDEAGQITQPAVLGTLMLASSFVLVGDHMQLPPLVTSDAAMNGGKST
jgi:DNA replication ATP-dependent helicase Dna2